jgi:hypothetical protein
MATVLPNSVNYTESLPSLPDNTTQIPVVAMAINGQTFTPGQQIQVDLLNRGFLVPDSLYIRYTTSIVTTGTTTASSFVVGCPVYTPINRLDVQIGSQTVDTIQNYNNVMNLLSNTTLDIAQKYGQQSTFGYQALNTAGTAVELPNLEELDGRELFWAAGTQSYSVGAPLMCVLSNADKLLPLFSMPQVRLVFTVESLGAMIVAGAGQTITSFTISNFELCYKVVDMGGAVEEMVRNMGDKIYVKSQSFASASQTLASGTSGFVELVYNQRYASVKSLFVINGGTSAASINKSFDSYDITSNNGDYSFTIGGVIYPQKAISSVVNRAGALMELKSALGSIYDKNNNFSINSIEYSYVSNNTGQTAFPNTTTAFAPAKFYIGTSVEKLNSDSLLTGISTQNSAISYRVNIGLSTAQAHTCTLIVNYDALFEIDTVNRQVSLKC